MREWAHTFGAAVRQRTIRQETSMARAGTLPNFLYQREIVPGENVDLTGDVLKMKTGMRHVAVRRRRKSTRRTSH